MVTDRKFFILSYIIFLAILIIFKPPFYITIPLIVAYVTTKSIIKKRTFKQWLITMGLLAIITITFYFIGYFLGGLWSIILIHLLGVGFIIYANKELILKAHHEVQKHARHIALKQKRYKEWEKKQKT